MAFTLVLCLVKSYYLDNPLVTWNFDTLECPNVHFIMNKVYDVFVANLLTNPLCKKFLCLICMKT